MIRAFTLAAILVVAQTACGQESAAAKPETKKKPHPALLNPKLATEKAPAKFDAVFSTTKGDFVVTVEREWSPNGADRFYNLIRIGYLNDIGIFRAVKKFMFQFGIHGDPKVNQKWFDATIKDDKKVGVPNKPGFITFAKTGQPNSRSTQFFVNLGDNGFLDSQGFTPFGKVTKGMDVVGKINTEYGENLPQVQGEFKAKGNTYIRKQYPKLDFIKSVKLVEPKKKEKKK